MGMILGRALFLIVSFHDGPSYIYSTMCFVCYWCIVISVPTN